MGKDKPFRNRGKSICNRLRFIRHQIALENEIELKMVECHYNGPCSGHCLRCETELKYLEDRLKKRKQEGKLVKYGVMLAYAPEYEDLVNEGLFGPPAEPLCGCIRSNSEEHDFEF